MAVAGRPSRADGTGQHNAGGELNIWPAWPSPRCGLPIRPARPDATQGKPAKPIGRQARPRTIRSQPASDRAPPRIRSWAITRLWPSLICQIESGPSKFWPIVGLPATMDVIDTADKPRRRWLRRMPAGRNAAMIAAAMPILVARNRRAANRAWSNVRHGERRSTGTPAAGLACDRLRKGNGMRWRRVDVNPACISLCGVGTEHLSR